MQKEISRRTFLAGTAAVAFAALSGCGNNSAIKSKTSGEGESNSSDNAASAQGSAYRTGVAGSPDACTLNVGLMMGPSCMGLCKAMDAAKAKETYNTINYEVLSTMDFSELAAYLNDGTYDIVTMPSNIGAIMYNNENINTDVMNIQVCNLGVLYIGTTDSSVSKLSDLAGKTLYCMGEGGTPGYTAEYTIQAAGLKDSVNLVYKATPFEILNAFLKEENVIAVMPQPFVEMSKTMVDNVVFPIDLTEEWERLNPDGSEPVTSCAVVNKAFLEEHEQAVIEYLQLAVSSTEYTLAHMDEAATWQEDHETFLNNSVAAKAMPYCNIVAHTGETMKTELSGFLQVLCDMNSKSVGGKMPSDDFYYLPAEGVLSMSMDEVVAMAKKGQVA